jgi:hypothetical protein
MGRSAPTLSGGYPGSSAINGGPDRVPSASAGWPTARPAAFGMSPRAPTHSVNFQVITLAELGQGGNGRKWGGGAQTDGPPDLVDQAAQRSSKVSVDQAKGDCPPLAGW